MKTKMAMLLVSVLGMVSVLTGCTSETASGASVDEEEDDGTQAVGTSTEALTISTSGGLDLPYRGGSGGTGTRTACRSGDVAIGYTVTFGNFINSVSLICTNPSVYNGAKYSTTTRGTVGPKSWQYICPSGTAIGGLQGRSATYLDALGVYCDPYTIYGEGKGEGTYTGGTGGRYFSDHCPYSYYVTSLYLQTGNWVDGVRGACSYGQR
jgi:hypothetical protein